MLRKINYGDVITFKAARTIFKKPLYFSHFFFIDGLLIDTGFAHVSAEVLEAVKKLPVKKILITHQHEDHTGNCELLQRKLHVPVYAHPETIKVLKNPPNIEVYRKLIWGNPPPAEPLPVEKQYKMNRYIIESIYAPGHSIDHTCYFEPQNRYLFCGDLYLGENLTGFMIGENIAAHFKSLEYMISLKPTVLFCGLKGRLDDAENRLRRKYAAWWDIGCRVKKLHDAKASPKQILKEIFGGEIYFYYFSQNNWGRRYMINSIIDNIEIFNQPTKISL